MTPPFFLPVKNLDYNSAAMYIYMCLLSGAADHCEFRVCQSDCPNIIGGHTVLYQRCLDLESEIEITAVLLSFCDSSLSYS